MEVWTSARTLFVRFFARNGHHSDDEILPAPPELPAAQANLDEPDEGFSMLHELLDDVESPLPSTDPAILLTRKNATIAGLQDLLSKLRPMGEQVAELERLRYVAEDRARTAEERLDGLVQRVEALDLELERARSKATELAENGLSVPDGEALSRSEEQCKRLTSQVQRLERRLSEREAVLERERKRHAANRALLSESRALATERWHEIQRLRREISNPADPTNRT